MIVAKIRVNGVWATHGVPSPIPKGIIGGQVLFEYTDPMWDGLTKTVVFQGAVTKDVVNAGNTVTIPPECVDRAGIALLVGVYGTDADDNIAIPTIWADLGHVRAAADPSGDESTDDSLPVWAQLEGRVKELEEHGTGGGKDEVYILAEGESIEDAPADAEVVIDPYGQSGEEESTPGGYYLPGVKQTDDSTMTISFTPSAEGMPTVESVNVTLPPGPKGNTGAAGYTPIKGTDYWTAEDRAAMVNDVLAEFVNVAEVGA